MFVPIKFPNCFLPGSIEIWEEILKERNEYYDGNYQHIEVSIQVYESMCREYEQRTMNGQKLKDEIINRG